MKSYCLDKVPQDIERVRASWLVVVLVGRRVPTNALGAGALFPKAGDLLAPSETPRLNGSPFLTSQGRREDVPIRRRHDDDRQRWVVVVVYRWTYDDADFRRQTVFCVLPGLMAGNSLSGSGAVLLGITTGGIHGSGSRGLHGETSSSNTEIEGRFWKENPERNGRKTWKGPFVGARFE